jgi:glycosyltransferase involved in cell wall biosynthesis
VVFDSHSDDGTTELATRLGARVFQRKFDNYGAQREAARNLSYKYPWVLAVDADERPEPDLVEEIQAIVRAQDCPHAAFRLRRKDHFMGKWIKYSTLYPSWFIRLYRTDLIRYEPRSVHEYPEVFGSIGELKGHLQHFSFNKGLEEWFVKHCRYATLEAQENLKSLVGEKERIRFSLLAITDPVKRRRFLKDISIYLPCRPLLRFLYSYIFRRGFLDGVAGYRYAKMLAIYEQMIVLNMHDIRHQTNPPSNSVPESS